MSSVDAPPNIKPSRTDNPDSAQETAAFTNTTERSEFYKEKLDRLAEEARHPPREESSQLHPLVEKGEFGSL